MLTYCTHVCTDRWHFSEHTCPLTPTFQYPHPPNPHLVSVAAQSLSVWTKISSVRHSTTKQSHIYFSAFLFFFFLFFVFLVFLAYHRHALNWDLQVAHAQHAGSFFWHRAATTAGVDNAYIQKKRQQICLLSLPVMTGNHTRRGGGGGGRGGVKRRRRKKNLTRLKSHFVWGTGVGGRERGDGRWTGNAIALYPDTCSSRVFYFLIIFFFKLFSIFLSHYPSLMGFENG